MGEECAFGINYFLTFVRSQEDKILTFLSYSSIMLTTCFAFVAMAGAF